MKKIIFITMIVFIGLAQSCSEYLDETNPNFSPVESFYANLDESESNLTSVYGGMLDEFVLNLEREFFRSDLAHPGPRNNPTGAYRNWYQHAVGFDDRFLQQEWESKYRVIWRANQVIEGLNGMSDDLKAFDRWTEQMGQARFFRGLMHFYLHSTFNEGRIIIRDKVPSSTAEYSKAVSLSEDVMVFFRADLQYAYDNLPPKMMPVSRVDAGTAATILGTSYLYEGNTLKAAEYFDDIINNVNGNYGYKLEQDVTEMFNNSGHFNDESIFEINYADNIQPQDDNFDEESFFNRMARYSGPQGRHAETKLTFGGQAIILPSAWLTFEYSNEPMDLTDPRNYIDGDVLGTLRTIPLRGTQSIAVVNDELSNYYGYTQPQAYTFAGTRFSLYKKYTNHDIVEREFDTNTTGWKSGRNVVVNRLSGVYLMQAECLLKNGDVDGAIALVNEIRKRWGLKQISTTPDADFDLKNFADPVVLMEHLMYVEYPLELSLEGFSTRLIDLRRWGVAKERFDKLSGDVYSVVNYTYVRTNGRTARRNQSMLQEGNGPRSFSEYIDAAAAWSIPDADKKVGYFPLPQNETLNNNNVNGTD